ncbi:MAG: type III pantothenate kinase [Bacteroidales bacterium]|jgi:type III pantothenate kinase|nr:type III pantothenate kinase [Bacteroidales bacterium]
MANLIIDAGNSFIKLYVIENNTIICKFIFEINEKFEIKKIDFLNEYTIYKCIISTVRNQFDENFLNFLESKFDVFFLSHSMKFPVKINYKIPETLGLDRIAAVVGASVILPNTNVLIIDAGTAITFDILNNNGEFLGGIISPGINTRFLALNKFTEKLPLISKCNQKNLLFGQTTEEAIICGVQNGIFYEVKSNINHFQEKFDDLYIIFTGGDALFFENLFKSCIFAEQNLIAIGLNKILELNA